MTEGPKAFNYKFPRRPFQIIKLASSTLGIDLKHLSSKLGISEGEFRKNLLNDTVETQQWIEICQELSLDPECYIYGYSTYFHQLQLGRQAIRYK